MMYEMIAILSGACIGTACAMGVMGRAASAVLAVASGVAVAWLSGELAHSALFAAFDAAQVLVAAVLADRLVVALRRVRPGRPAP